MAVGKKWTNDERASLARAWIFASTDPIVGKDQTGKRFFQTVHSRFISFAPQNEKARYASRSMESVRQKFSEISADCQKFKLAIRRVTNAKPTGVGVDENISMAVAIHIGRETKMNYEQKDLSHDVWPNVRAWKMLRTCPKWECDSLASTVDANTTILEAGTLENKSTVLSPSQTCNGEVEVEGNANDTSPKRRAVDGNGVGLPGRSKAKALRKEEQLHKAMNDIALAMKKKVEALEERNSISLFQCEDYNLADEEDKRVRTEYLRMSRLFHLERLKKRVKNFSGEERIDGEPGHCGGGIGSSSEKKKRRRPAHEEERGANKQQKITANNVLDVSLSAAEKVAVDALVRKGGMERAIGSHIEKSSALVPPRFARRNQRYGLTLAACDFRLEPIALMSACVPNVLHQVFLQLKVPISVCQAHFAGE